MANNTIKLNYEDITDASPAEMNSNAKTMIEKFRSRHYHRIGSAALGNLHS